MSTRARVLFHRTRAAAWVAIGAASFAIGAAEAADDRALVERLDRIERIVAPRPRRLTARPAGHHPAARRLLIARAAFRRPGP